MLPQTNDAKTIFLEAVEKHPPIQWPQFLDQACKDDSALREHVEALLKAHGEPNRMLDGHGFAPPLISLPPEKPGTTIGRYKLLEEIGEGGMGVVYMAEQREPVHRKVALKIIKPGMDTREVIARFEAERQALAMMDHPNIARVFDGGTTESGRPYFVMERVVGLPITDYCDRANLTTHQRLSLFVLVCQAVQHAHQKGVIHRDLKPSNILVTMCDGVAIPKVIDFGIAKAVNQSLTEKTLFTGHGRMVGTPLYMSPEQAEVSSVDVDTRSDIYSLGVLLYELLTGNTPFDRERLREAGYDEIRRVIREEEPPRPSRRLSTLDAEAMSTITAHRGVDARSLSRLVTGDLDWIVMKALEKDRTRRYESASALTADVERHLADEPIQARPPTLADHVAKWARRHRPLVLMAGIALILIAFVSIASAVLVAGAYQRESDQRVNAEKLQGVAEKQANEADAQREIAVYERNLAQERELLARRHVYAAQMQMAKIAWDEGQSAYAKGLLERQLPKLGGEDWRSFEWHYLSRLFHPERWTLPADGAAMGVVFLPNRNELVAACGGGGIRLFDARTGKCRILLDQQAACWAVALSRDARILAAGDIEGRVHLWKTSDWSLYDVLQGHPKGITTGVQSLAFSADGGTLAVAAGPFFGSRGQTEVALWDLTQRKKRLLVSYADAKIHCVAFSPDGKTLATSGGPVRLWDVATGRQVQSLPDSAPAHFVAFSADGKLVAAGAWWGAKVWERSGLREVLSVPDSCFCLALSADSRILATAGMPGRINLWDIPTREKVAGLDGHTNWIWSLAFSSDGKTLASAARDKSVRIWDLERARSTDIVPAKGNRYAAVGLGETSRTPVAFLQSGSSTWLAAGAAENSVRLCDIRGNQAAKLLRGPTSGINSLSFTLDGKWLAAATGGTTKPGEVFRWVLPGGQNGPPLEQSNGVFSSVAVSVDGKTLAAGTGKTVKLWDMATGKLRGILGGHAGDVASVAFSPDGTILAAATLEFREYPNGVERHPPGEVKLWNLGTMQVRSTISWSLRHCSVDFSPDGRFLAVAGWNEFKGAAGGEASVWEVQSGDRVAIIEGHSLGVLSVAFSPDGKLLATGGEHGRIKLTDTHTWLDRLCLKWAEHPIRELAFSPDGETLAAGDGDEIRLWHGSKSQTPTESTARNGEK